METRKVDILTEKEIIIRNMEEKMCKVSIIMPVYNKEKYVERAVESVISQTYKNWELLIINDGSTDSSLEVCKKFIQDKRIFLYDIHNSGVSSARNYGLEKAKGEYIAFVDGDDEINPFYLEKLLATDCDMVISGLTRKGKNEEITSILTIPYEGRKLLKDILHSFYFHQNEKGIYGFIAGKIIRRDIIKNNNIKFNESFRLAEDFDFFLKVYNCIEEIVFIDEALYYYYDANADVFNIETEDIPSQIEIQWNVKNFLQGKGVLSIEDEEQINARISSLIYTYLITSKSGSYNEFKQYINKIELYLDIVKICKSNHLSNTILKVFKARMYKITYLLLITRKALKKIKGK